MLETHAICSIDFDRRHDGIEKEVCGTLENIITVFKQRRLL
jgi:hypothetical protein